MMDEKRKLDPMDWAILRVLQDDATLSVGAVGEKVGLSHNPCWRRIRRLEDDGVIARRVALLDPAKVGLATTVFVAIRITRHDAAWLETFASAVDAMDEVIECHRMAGDIDYMLKIRVRDIADYDRIYQRLISRVPGLSDVTASFSMEEMKFTTALPRPD